MKTIERVIQSGMVVTAIACMTILGCQAQPGNGTHGGHGSGGPDSCHMKQMVADMAKELSLSDDQQLKIEEIHYAHMQEMKALHDKYKNNCEGEPEAHHKLMQKLEGDIKAVLNADQQAKYDEFIKDKRGQHGGPPRQRDVPPEQ